MPYIVRISTRTVLFRDQPTNQPTNQPTYEPTCQPTVLPTYQPQMLHREVAFLLQQVGSVRQDIQRMEQRMQALSAARGAGGGGGYMD